MKSFSLEVKKKFSVPAEMIYDAWLDPNSVKEWMCPGEGVSVPAPQIDAVVGGKFQFDMVVGENTLPHHGEYKKLNRAKEIQFTWNSINTNNEDSLVTVNIDSIDSKSCELTLTHELLPTETTRDGHKGGWTNILKTLNEKLSR